ncbi:MAG: exodeoxyribonuclease V subunit beta [Buchnera aphidicola (Melaphis rhois)]
MQQRKKKQEIFEFDDLIQSLYKILNKKNENISKIIKKKYPILLIDEFQDTNRHQYKIFEKIYKSQEDTCILMSDPKQAIYSFRGADISYYLKVKKRIKKHYQLNINWRSSKEMVESINLLFLRIKNIFFLPNIDFVPTKSSYQEKQIEFKINGILQPAIRFLFNDKPIINKNEYEHWISKACVNYISFWINEGKKENAIIIKNNKAKFISAKDICILVNNKRESSIIQEALNASNIPTTFLSQKTSVFHSIEALELLWIFQAILNPKNEFVLKRALSTSIISNNSYDIDVLTNKYSTWSNVINEFSEYLMIWENIGIENVIYKIIKNYKISENNHVPNITNMLHIGELLEKQFNKTKKKYILIFWLEKKIEKKQDIPDTDYIRSRNNKNCIKITTIHKSKGLEYPIICIPFSITPYNFCSDIDSTNNTMPNITTRKKILSENMRLLYVALTRAIVHCCIGIASIQNDKILKKNNYSNIYNNALKYVIQLGTECNSKQLHIMLKKISYNQNIEVNSIIPHFSAISTNYTENKINANTKKLTRILEYNYDITSYSKLKKNYSLLTFPKKSHITCMHKNIKINSKEKNKHVTPHSLPKGNIFGIFIHKILKNINFHEIINQNWISNQLEKNNFNKTWDVVLKNWINTILNTPLNHSNLVLSQLHPKNYIKELEFFLPIKNKITDMRLNKIVNMFNPILNTTKKICFDPIKGILVGSIDLIFRWKKKYYLVDYKSNWLGHSISDYSKKSIHHAITTNFYDLQYQLYSVALHRYLSQRIKNYTLNKYFGGIYILFLRAMDNTNSQQGLFFTLPEPKIIKDLNDLFK